MDKSKLLSTYDTIIIGCIREALNHADKYKVNQAFDKKVKEIDESGGDGESEIYKKGFDIFSDREVIFLFMEVFK